MRNPLIPFIPFVVLLSACASTPELETPREVKPITVPTPPSCYEVASLKRVVIPAETRTVVSTNMIENPPYEPITHTTTREIVTKAEQVYYVTIDPETGNETQVTNFCTPVPTEDTPEDGQEGGPEGGPEGGQDDTP